MFVILAKTYYEIKILTSWAKGQFTDLIERGYNVLERHTCLRNSVQKMIYSKGSMGSMFI